MPSSLVDGHDPFPVSPNELGNYHMSSRNMLSLFSFLAELLTKFDFSTWVNVIDLCKDTAKFRAKWYSFKKLGMERVSLNLNRIRLFDRKIF
jgi:hypothetical protein